MTISAIGDNVIPQSRFIAKKLCQKFVTISNYVVLSMLLCGYDSTHMRILKISKAF